MESGILKLGDDYYVDIQPGGRAGQRWRRRFSSYAEAVEFKREKSSGVELSEWSSRHRIKVLDLLKMFTERYARPRFSGFCVDKYRLKTLEQFFSLRNKPISRVRLSDGEEYITFRKSLGLKPATINRELTLLKLVFSWAVKNDYIPFSPFAKRLKGIDGEKSRVRWLTEAECGRLLHYAKETDRGLYEFILVGLNTGFRLGNLMRLEARDIGPLMIHARETKSGDPYDVPASPQLQPFLSELRSRPGQVLDISNIRKRFKLAAKACGLYSNKDDAQKVTIHTLRHTFASYWLQKGIPLLTVSKWMGHKTTRMTEEVYGHLSDAHHSEAIQRFSPLGFSVVNPPPTQTGDTPKILEGHLVPIV